MLAPNESTRERSLAAAWLPALIACLTAACPPASAGEPVKAPVNDPAALLRAPPGLRASVFADETQVKNPVAICFDERGRMYVAQAGRIDFQLRDNRFIGFWVTDDIAARTLDDRLAYYKKWS